MLSVVCPHPLPQEGPRVRWLYDVFEYWKQTFVILVFLFVVCVSGMAFAILMVTLYCYYRPQPNKWTLNWTAVSVLFNGNTNPTPRHFKTRLLETTSSLLLLFFFFICFYVNEPEHLFTILHPPRISHLSRTVTMCLCVGNGFTQK